MLRTFSTADVPQLEHAHELDALTGIFVRARLRLAGKEFAGTLERLCVLTPYAAETIADDAVRAGRGSRLEVTVAAADGEDAVTRVRARFASLATRGINLVVRSQCGIDRA